MSLGIDIFNTTRVQATGTITNDYTTRDRGASITLGPVSPISIPSPSAMPYPNQLRYNVAPMTPPGRACPSPQCAADPNCNEFHALIPILRTSDPRHPDKSV